MEALFASVVRSVVINNDAAEQAMFAFVKDERKRHAIIRRRNLDVSRVAMLVLGAMAAAAGKLWHEAIKRTVEPYLGSQISVCPSPLPDDAARLDGVVPGVDFIGAKDPPGDEPDTLTDQSNRTEADVVFAAEQTDADATAIAGQVCWCAYALRVPKF